VVRPDGNRRGGVLLVVLGVLVALGIVVSLLGSYALERALLAETRGGKAETGTGYKLASAIETSVAVLTVFEEVGGTLRSPAEGWGNPAELLEGWPEELAGVEVEVFDESARPGLGQLEESDLKGILEELGLSRGKADELGDLLLDWMDEDRDERFQGRENTALSRDDDPWVANRTPGSWEEIWAIPEWGEEAYDPDGQLREWARLFSRSFSLRNEGAANINAVDDETVELLHDAQLIGNPRWLEDRRGFDDEIGTEDDEVLSEMPTGMEEAGNLLGLEAKLLRVRAGMKVGERYVWKEVWLSRASDEEDSNGEGERPPEPTARSEEGRGNGASSWGEWELLEVRDGLSLVLEETVENE